MSQRNRKRGTKKGRKRKRKKMRRRRWSMHMLQIPHQIDAI